MQNVTLLDRLAAHRTLSGVPRDQLEWLVTHGHERTLEPGEVLTPSTGPVKGLYVVLDGHLLIRVDRGAGPRIVMEWRGGDVTGMLPYSRIKGPPGDVVAEERTTILMVDTATLPQLIHECDGLTAVLVHVMVDRARVFKSSELLDEKMASLGRLAAGLAHELNNPASAAARSAKTLLDQLSARDRAAEQFGALRLTDAQVAAIAAIRSERSTAALSLSPLEVADQQDALATWLASHGVAGVDVEPLVAFGFQLADLQKLEDQAGRENLTTVLGFVSSGLAVRQLATEIGTAATRIHSLVAAVKGFTYLNQQATLQPIDIERGLSDTITVLQAKARSRAVTLTLTVAPGLPNVEGYGGELNQVWANLLDNAIDAAPQGTAHKGHVTIDANVAPGNTVVVRVIDNGPGIPPEIANRIFDPFFTTKGIGQGTGLGLDIARRIVMHHQGTIDMSTSPGGTEFRVALPVSRSAPPQPASS